MSIKERIMASNDENEIESLLAEIKAYKHAHPSTVRKCERAAKARIATIKSGK